MVVFPNLVRISAHGRCMLQMTPHGLKDVIYFENVVSVLGKRSTEGPRDAQLYENRISKVLQ